MSLWRATWSARASLALATACAPVDVPPDVAFLPVPDAWYSDRGACGNGSDSFDRIPVICDTSGRNHCANLAEETLPGWDVSVACDDSAARCVRGSQCVAPDGAGVDAGGARGEYCCGDGPPCSSGYTCARPFGSDNQFTCVCSVLP